MRIVLIAFILAPFLSIGQVSDPFLDQHYEGPPHQVFTGSRSSMPGHVYRVAFCTMNIPDSLIITMCDESYSFYVGNEPDDGLCLRGPLHLELNMMDNTVDTLSTVWPTAWEDYGPICWKPGGFLLFDFVMTHDCCLLDWRFAGNATDWTRFSVRMWEWPIGGMPPVDTVRSYSCDGHREYYEGEDCDITLVIEADSSIDSGHETFNPVCGDNGAIVFDRYPMLDTFGLAPGRYDFVLSNSVCSKSVQVTLTDETACSVYTPNVFMPDGDGHNDVWFIGSDKNFEYLLWIYDRWGNLVYEGIGMLNSTGWDGQGAAEGVYAFKAVIKDINSQLFYGDITLLR